MKLFSAEQIRKWDQFTILNEPISSIDLMERAAKTCFLKIQASYEFESYAIVCGPGNNGGDGLAIARLLLEDNRKVEVLIPKISTDYSDDFQINLKRLPQEVLSYFDKETLLDFNTYDCIVDAIFGSGLTRPLADFSAQLVTEMNASIAFKISIDIPSGLYADIENLPVPTPYFYADITYTFQVKKSCFFNPAIRENIGQIEVLDIGLSKTYAFNESTNYFEVLHEDIQLKESSDFTHKFLEGFALIIGGSYGKFGAPILTAKAALRTGCGLVSVAIPIQGREMAHASCNELMLVEIQGTKYIESVEIPEKVNAIGIGPGLDKQKQTVHFLSALFQNTKARFVIDADALNILAENRELFQTLPKNSILTPHLGEFKRLFGDCESIGEQIDLLRLNAKKHQIYIVLKGKITMIANPSGVLYFSEEVGNKGMATAGSGDVLTGIITSLLAQGYSELEAALYGVYIHGLAGDLHLKDQDYRSLIASDIINNIGKALKNLAD